MHFFRGADSKTHTGLTSDLIWSVRWVIGLVVKDVEGANGIVSNRCLTNSFFLTCGVCTKNFFLNHSIVIRDEGAFKEPSLICRAVNNYTQWWTLVNFVNVFFFFVCGRSIWSFKLSTEKPWYVSLQKKWKNVCMSS